MIRRFIIEAEDSLKGCDEAIDKLVREWGAEEIEPCEDAVSREAVMISVNKVLAPYIPKLMEFTLPLELARAINNLPSVTPQKKGKWIKYDFLEDDGGDKNVE